MNKKAALLVAMSLVLGGCLTSCDNNPAHSDTKHQNANPKYQKSNPRYQKDSKSLNEDHYMDHKKPCRAHSDP